MTIPARDRPPTPPRSATVRRRVASAFRLTLLAGLVGLTAWTGLQRPALRAAEQAFAGADYQDTLQYSLDDLRLYPWSRAANLLAARAFSREIYPDRAEPYYRAAARFGALPLTAQQDRIQGLIRGLKNEAAVALCRQVLAAHPDDPTTLRYLATTEWAQGRLPEARDAAERLARTTEGQVDGLSLQASIHRDADRRERAVAALEAVLRVDPKLERYRGGASNFWMQFANDLVILKRYEEARDHLTKVITPYSNPVLLDILGSAQKELNARGEAERLWRESARRDPKRLNPWLRLGSLMIQTKRYAEAIEPLERAVALGPVHMEANYLLARAYDLSGRADAAKAQFAKAEAIRRAAPPQPGAMRPSP